MRRAGLLTLLALPIAALLYRWKLRDRVLNWGAAADEASAHLPGDELLEDAVGVATRTVTQAPGRSAAPSREEVPVFVTEGTRAKLMEIYDEALRRWPVPYETSFVATRYGQTHVITSGDPASPPLVMTHPAAVGAFVWSSIIASLSERRRVYALDTIGDVGRSELADPDRYPKKGRDYSAWLDDVYEKLELTQADVVAGSMGGWIAMNDAIYAPERVSRLVLLGTMGLPSWASETQRLGADALLCVASDGREARPDHRPFVGTGRNDEPRVPSVDADPRPYQGVSWPTVPSVGPQAQEDHRTDSALSRGKGRARREPQSRGQACPAQHRRLPYRNPAGGRARHERRRARSCAARIVEFLH